MAVHQFANISFHKLLMVAEQEILKATKLHPELGECVDELKPAQFHFNVEHLQETGFN